MSKTKTNVIRLLEAAKADFELLEYEVDESDLSGDTAAAKLGIPPEQMFKTLVFRGEKNGVGVCCIPVHEELDLKKAAKQFGEKKIEMLHVRDLLPTARAREAKPSRSPRSFSSISYPPEPRI